MSGAVRWGQKAASKTPDSGRADWQSARRLPSGQLPHTGLAGESACPTLLQEVSQRRSQLRKAEAEAGGFGGLRDDALACEEHFGHLSKEEAQGQFGHGK